MKTLLTITLSLASTAAFAQTPNNYIGTNDSGVISERYGNDPNTIITRDMATQNELDKTNGTVNLLTQEVRGRDKATNDRIDNLAGGDKGDKGKTGNKGKDGADGADGKDAIAPLGSLSFAAASASFYGDGIGFGLSASNYSSLEGSIVLGFDLDNGWRMVGGITTDFNKKTAVSVGIGYSF
jgi:hypothetical protein